MNRALPLFPVFGLIFAACSSTKPLESRTLPFHVAIVPMDAPIVGEVSPGELSGDATDLRLELSQDEVTQTVSNALQQYCFSRVTVLDQADLEESTDAFERQRLLLERARASDADLLVEFGLRYDPEVYREKASTFWLNYPLFLFAGPSNWFIGDNGYYADVELTTTVYDLNVIDAGRFALGDPAARVLSASARFTGSELDFTDRSDGVRDYVMGIVIPSGHLARESESTLGEVHQRILEELRSQVVQGIQSRRHDLVRAEWIAPMYMEPDEVSITREGDDALVRGSVRVRKGSLVGRVTGVTAEAGAEQVISTPDVDAAALDAGYDVYPFEIRVPIGDGARELRIECEAGTRDRFVRSYTFAL